MFEGVRIRVQVDHEAGSGHFVADCLEQYSSASVVSVVTACLPWVARVGTRCVIFWKQDIH